MSDYKISSTVPPQFVKWRVVDYLATRFHYLSAEAWADWVAQGKVWRNGVVCTLESIVTAGDMVSCALPDWEQPEANLDYKIVYEDEWLLGVNKPANLRVHSGGAFLKMNLMYQLKYEHEPSYRAAELANRLDADTSGVVLVGKSGAVVREMGKLFAAQAVAKRYTAVVHGVPALAEGLIDAPIGKVPHTRVRFGTGENLLKPKLACTRYAIAHADEGKQLAVLAVRPETGRTHQIRVHCASIGHPLVGDKLYLSGSDEEFVAWSEAPEHAPDAELIGRHALHCDETSFVHPFTGRPCVVRAPWPDDMARLVGLVGVGGA